MRKKAQAIQKKNNALHVLYRWGYEYLEQKLMAEKTKKKLEEAAQSRSARLYIFTQQRKLLELIALVCSSLELLFVFGFWNYFFKVFGKKNF